MVYDLNVHAKNYDWPQYLHDEGSSNTYTYTITVPSIAPILTPTPGGPTHTPTLAPTAGKPIVTINSPSNGSVLPSSGGINIVAKASDPQGIALIKIYIDNTRVKTCNSVTSCSYWWNNLSLVSPGEHSIRAEAFDKAHPSNMGYAEIKVIR